MKYNVFTKSEKVAEILEDAFDRPSMVDLTFGGRGIGEYQFPEISEDRMRSSKSYLFFLSEHLEIRDSETSELIWPSRTCERLVDVLDLL